MTPEEIKLYGKPLYSRGGRPTTATTLTHRRCTLCHQWKKYSEFHNSAALTPSITYICKVCEKKRRALKRPTLWALEALKYGSLLPGSRVLTATHKKCSKCKEWKEHKDFGSSLTMPGGLVAACKLCTRITTLKRHYNITLEHFDSMFKSQNGVCAICGTPFAQLKTRDLHVDHDHKTGVIRGLLCSHCNFMLGYAKDTPSSLRQGALYLERNAK